MPQWLLGWSAEVYLEYNFHHDMVNPDDKNHDDPIYIMYDT